MTVLYIYILYYILDYIQHNGDVSLEDCVPEYIIHSFIQYSVWRQVQSLLQNDASI